MRYVAINLFVLVLSSCGSNEPAPLAKVEGPNIETLRHEQLVAALKECDRYGRHDDPRAKYTERYCAAATSAHAMEGFTTKSTAPVDPTITRMH